MPRYRIGLTRTVTEGATVFIDALTKDEAEAEAFKMIEDGDHAVVWDYVGWETHPTICESEEV